MQGDEVGFLHVVAGQSDVGAALAQPARSEGLEQQQEEEPEQYDDGQCDGDEGGRYNVLLRLACGGGGKEVGEMGVGTDEAGDPGEELDDAVLRSVRFEKSKEEVP